MYLLEQFKEENPQRIAARAKFKLSQNRSGADRQRAIAALESTENPMEVSVAKFMS